GLDRDGPSASGFHHKPQYKPDVGGNQPSLHLLTWLTDNRVPETVGSLSLGPALPTGDPLGVWLGRHEVDVVAYLRDLVRIPIDNPPGDCAEIALRVEDEFRRFGIDVERHDVQRESGPPAPTVLGWLGA